MINSSKTREFKLPILQGGLNLRDLEHQIEDNQSPNMDNLWYRDRVLSKRWGQEYVDLVDTTDSTVTLDGDVLGISSQYEGYVCVHAGEKLYKWDVDDDIAVELGAVAEKEGVFTQFNGYLYHMDGTEIRQINSSYTLSTVTPYVPLVYIGCEPDFSASTSNEAYNLIGAGFKAQYNGDGATTSYKLPLSAIDTTAVSISVSSVALTENTNFTVNRTNGTINFAAGTSPHGAPAEGTNNVEITAYKTVSGAKAKIAACTIAIPYGGESSDLGGGTRCFVMGNPSYPRTYWYSDLGAGQGQGFTYFPDNQYEELIQNNEDIKAAAKQGGELIIFKERSCFAVSYEFDGEEVYYPLREFNSAIGCNIPKSVQLIDNHLVFANTYGGVFMVVNTAGTSEENIKPISSNINGTKHNKGLLGEASSDLVAATSADYDRKYWLCVGTNVYLWDYDIKAFYGYSNYEKAQTRLAWFRFSGINADAWYTGSDSLYCASLTKLVRFIKTYSDFGSAIDAYWYSKAFDFGYPNYYKTVTLVFPSLRVDTNSAVTLQVANESKDVYFEIDLETANFSWANFNWSTFTWNVIRFAKPFKTKPKMKKVVYCQLKLLNEENYRDMGISNIVLQFFINGQIKR